jgi:hypothetical protein
VLLALVLTKAPPWSSGMDLKIVLWEISHALHCDDFDVSSAIFQNVISDDGILTEGRPPRACHSVTGKAHGCVLHRRHVSIAIPGQPNVLSLLMISRHVFVIVEYISPDLSVCSSAANIWASVKRPGLELIIPFHVSLIVAAANACVRAWPPITEECTGTWSGV